MKCFIANSCMFLITTSLFCAQNKDVDHVDNDGRFRFGSIICAKEQAQQVAHLYNLIHQNAANAQAKQIYEGDLLRLPPAKLVIFSLLTSVVEREPECAERMIYEFISPQEEPFRYAHFLAWTGETYLNMRRYRDAARAANISLQTVSNMSAMLTMMEVYKKYEHYQGQAYWAGKYLHLKYTLEGIEVVKEYDQACKNIPIDFKKVMADIMKNEDGGSYDPRILLDRDDL